MVTDLELPCNKYSKKIVQNYLASYPIAMLINDIEGMLKKARPDKAIENRHCIERIQEALEKTGHVARARSVAFMAALCRYLARLVEAYGISPYYSGVVPGKGRDIHRILAIAAHELFEEFPFRNAGTTIDFEVTKVVRRAIYNVLEVDLLRKTSEYHDRLLRQEKMEAVREITEESKKEYFERVQKQARAIKQMLYNLVRFLVNYAEPVLKIKLERLRPLTEVQLVDYSFHIIGTPDLILEDEDSRRAIVIEWKSYGSAQAQPWEMAQAYVYTLLELRRLGYGGPFGKLERGDFIDFIKAFTKVKGDDVSVIPVVIRPSTRSLFYSTHPAIATRSSHNIKPADLCAVFHLIGVAAFHITALLVSVRDEEGYCKVNPRRLGWERVRADKVNIYRATPDTLRDSKLRELARFPRSVAGNPVKQSTYPCNYCKKAFKLVPPACRAHFGKNDLTEIERLIDRAFYGAMYAILEQHENDMMIYKALYNASLLDLTKKETRRNNFISAGGSEYFYTIFDEIILNISNIKETEDLYRFDVTSVELIKKDADKLIDAINIREIGNLRLYGISTVREGKPVGVYLVKTHGYTRPLTLNVNTFLRVDRVDLTKSKELHVILSVPSTALRFGLKLFAYHLLDLGCKIDKENNRIYCSSETLNENNVQVLAAETQVDLTYYDLEILDLMRRALLQISDEGISKLQDVGVDVDEMATKLDKYIDRLFRAFYGAFKVKLKLKSKLKEDRR